MLHASMHCCYAEPTLGHQPIGYLAYSRRTTSAKAWTYKPELVHMKKFPISETGHNLFPTLIFVRFNVGENCHIRS